MYLIRECYLSGSIIICLLLLAKEKEASMGSRNNYGTPAAMEVEINLLFADYWNWDKGSGESEAFSHL